MEARIAALEAKIVELADAVAVRDARIVELENLLGEVRRSGKRQPAPFSKGDPAEGPARPGRKKGKAHGRHGHRIAPPEPARCVFANGSGNGWPETGWQRATNGNTD